MTLPQTLIAVWQQVLAEGKSKVSLGEDTFPMGRTRARRLRTVEFTYGRHQIVGIEQNPETKSRWARLAQQGKRVMQFSCEGRYIANVCDGRLTRYPAWQALRLPE